MLKSRDRELYCYLALNRTEEYYTVLIEKEGGPKCHS